LKTYLEVKMLMPSNKIRSRRVRGVLSASFGIFLLALVAGSAQGQTLLSETTWGGAGSDVAHGIAVALDGTAYVVGLSDSFTTDQFNNPRPAISLVKYAPNGSVDWQRIWTGLTLRGGLRGPAVALSSDGSVYVSGQTTTNGLDAVLLKFDASGNLIWQRTWGGGASEESNAVATDIDGSVYIAGTTTSFGASSASLFVVKFDSAGNLTWQKIWEGASGLAVAVAQDGSVYAAGTRSRPGGIAEFDVVALKMTSAGNLLWDRTYSAGEVVDPRGGMAVAPDGSIVIAGAIQAPKSGIVDIAALLIKLDADGGLLFDREWGGKSGDVAAGVAVAQDGSIYMAGASNSFGVGNEDAFVVHVQANGKAADAVTWGGTGFDNGAGVGVAADGTVVLAATTTAPPPYSLLSAPKKVSAVKGIVAVAGGAFSDAAGVVADPGAAVVTPQGSTTFAGNFETALVRFIP
jgi:hypothetical protein